MKKQITQSIVGFIALLFLSVAVQAQSVTLTFTGKDANNNRVQLDRVSITNLTKGWQGTIYWPDTTLTMQNGGTDIDDYANNGGFGLSQNNPNPFNRTTDVLLTVADAGAVSLEITDVYGRTVVGANDYSPLPGHHRFRITLSAAGTYVMTARQNGKTSSIKMVNNGGGNGDGIEYAGIVETMCTSSLQAKSHTRGNTTNPFNFGDMMEYVGYATINGTEYESERITQVQGASQTHFLQFNEIQDGFPCPNAVTLTDIDGNVYHTVQIGQQCWMKENLRTTHHANNNPIVLGSDTSSTVAYRYYPDNDANNVSTYGYLYNWAAVMHGASSSGANPSGVQGICPTGWHVPSNAEWTQLTEYVRNISFYYCGEERDYIAKSLASPIGWHISTNACEVGNVPTENNSTGFSALPSGSRYGTQPSFEYYAAFWSSTEHENDTKSYYVSLHWHDKADMYHNHQHKRNAFSVRCVKD